MRIVYALFGLLLVSSWGLVCHYWYHLQEKAVIGELNVEMQHHLEASESHMVNELRYATALLRALSQSRVIQALVTSGGLVDARENLKIALTPIFSHMVEFRLLDATGMERERLVRVNDGAEFSLPSELVSRASSACFLEANAMPLGEVFVEPLSVPEQTHGTVPPQLPLLRVSMQVEGADKKRTAGVMVLYLNMRHLLWQENASHLPAHDSLRRIDPGFVYVLRYQRVEVLREAQGHFIPGLLSHQREIRLADWLPLIDSQRDTLWHFSEYLPADWSDPQLSLSEYEAWEAWSIGSLMVMLMLAGIAISRADAMQVDAERLRLLSEVKGLSRRLIRGNEDERRELARVLHDEVGQVLASLQMRLNGLAQDCEQDGCDASVPLRKEEEYIADMIAALRDQIRVLRPPYLDAMGLRDSLLGLLDEIQVGSGIRVEADIDAAVDHLGDEVAVRVYRILSDAVMNIRRHAGASQVRMQIHLRDGVLQCLLEDDGCGFDLTQESEGFGLVGMRERAGLLKGFIRIDSSPGHGTRVLLDFPCE